MLDPSARAPRSVLVVDDSEDDVLLLSMSLQQAQIPWKIVAALPDGEQAISWLQKVYTEPAVDPACRIDLLLIDLKMPRKNGFDVLRWVQTNLPGQFKTVVFSGSFAISDIMRARQFGAHFYYVKPVSSDGRKKILVHLEQLLFSGTPLSYEAEAARYFESILDCAF